ncbi:MAG: DegV family protein [Chloroflexi bacterium]|nr:DegV family protein [Chloroflexota bacterium]
MPKIAILTDSTANLPADLVSQHGITVVPLKIQWGDDSLIDGVSITTAEFYARLATDPNIPTTSQPSMMDFLQAYEALTETHDAILVLLISSGISGTVASAIAAAAEFSKIPVEIVDTQTTSAGLALVIEAAIQGIENGGSLEEVTTIVKAVCAEVALYFVVDTLKYLHRGGRIGGASRYLGTMLSIKPILYFNGTVEALTRVRGKKKAMQHLVQIVQEKVGNEPIRVALIHVAAADTAVTLQSMLEQSLNVDNAVIYELSPVIGTHVGPGAVGFAYHPTKLG